MEGLMKTHLLILKSYDYISCIMLHQGLGWLMKSGEQGENPCLLETLLVYLMECKTINLIQTYRKWNATVFHAKVFVLNVHSVSFTQMFLKNPWWLLKTSEPGYLWLHEASG